MFGRKKKPKPRRTPRRPKLPDPDPAKAARQKKRMQLILGLVAGALAVLGLAVGLDFLRDRTLRQNVPPISRVVLENQPDWMDDSTATQICQLVSDLAAENPSDLNLPAKAAVRLAQNIWVKRVAPAGVVNDYHGTLTIRCEFRKPIAVVSTGAFLVRVDEQRLVLPGKLLLSGVPVGKYKTILGVASQPPDPGQVWDSPDLIAAVELLRLIGDRPFSREITAVDVSNYNGRQDVSKPHIVMLTDQRTLLKWGIAIGSEGRIEVDYHKKLQHLEGLFAEHGSLNKLLYVDLTGREPRGKLRNGKQFEPR